MVGKDGSNFIGYILKHWFMMILGICDPWCLPNTPSLTKIAYLQWPSPKITQQVLNPWANISAAVLISPCTNPHNSFGITKNQLNFMFIGFHRWFRLGSVEICRNPVDQKAQKAHCHSHFDQEIITGSRVDAVIGSVVTLFKDPWDDIFTGQRLKFSP